MNKWLFIGCCIFFTFPASGQRDNYGVEFWTGFLGNLHAYKGDTNTLKLYIAAKQTTKVTVSVPLVSYQVTFTVAGGQVTEFKIPTKYVYISQSETLEKKGVHIVSDYPVAVSALNLLNYTTDASVVYPVKSILPKARYTAVVPEIKDTKSPSQTSVSELLLVGMEDSTRLRIIPTAETQKGRKAHVPYNLTINRGETYQINSFDNLDGTSVEVLNKKRLAVYTGNRCSEFPCGACDHQVEQLLADALLDTLYFALPQYGHSEGYWVKVASVDSALWIKINGKDFLIPSADSACVFEVSRGDSVLRISADRKFSVLQFMKGMNCNGYTLNPNYSPGNAWGDPSLVQLMSHRFFTVTSAFSTMMSANLGAHYVSVLVPENGINTVYLDGVKVHPSAFWKMEFDSRFRYAMLELSSGAHTLRSDSGHIAYVYGLGLTESYMYLAGYGLPVFNLTVYDSTLTYDCKNLKTTVKFEAIRTGGVDFHWDFGDGTTDTSAKVTHTFTVPGTYKVRLHVLSFNGERDSFVKEYKMVWPDFNPVYDLLLCDSSYVFEEHNSFFTDFRWQDNSKQNYFRVTGDTRLKVTAKDTSGNCMFSDSARVLKMSAHAGLFVDTLSNCAASNLYRFVDSINLKNDLVSHRILRYDFNGMAFKYPDFTFHFNRSGSFNAYLDVYPRYSTCKYTYTIPLRIKPSAKVALSVQDKPVCSGDTVTLTDSSTFDDGTINGYYAKFANGKIYHSTSGKVKAPVFFNYQTLDPVYTFKYFIQTSNGCFDTIKGAVVVLPAAYANFDYGGDSIKCLYLSRWNFNHTYYPDLAGNYSVLWNFGNGKSGSQLQYKNFRYTDTGLFRVTLTTRSDLGCRDSVSKWLRIIDQPKTGFRVNDSIQCLSENRFAFTNMSSSSARPLQWDFGDGSFSDSLTPVKQYAKAGRYPVRLRYQSKYPGCFNDSQIVHMSVLRSPIPDFTFNANPVCRNMKSVGVTNASVMHNGAGLYQWKSKYETMQGFNGGPFTFTDTGIQFVRLVATDSMGCTDSAIRSFKVEPLPIIHFRINDSIQCYGQQQFELWPDSGKPTTDSLVWRINGKVFSQRKDSVRLTGALQPGVHTFSFFARTRNGCADSLEKKANVLPPPRAFFTWNRDTQCFSDQIFQSHQTSTVMSDQIAQYAYLHKGVTISGNSELNAFKRAVSGLDSVMLRIVTKEGCTDSFMRKLLVVKNPEAFITGDTACLGSEVDFEFRQTSGDFPIQQATWQTGDGNILNGFKGVHTYVNDGYYFPVLNFNDKQGCSGQAKGMMVIYANPNADFDIEILRSDPDFTYVKLIPKIKGYKSYIWSFPDGSSHTGEMPELPFRRFFSDRIYLKTTHDKGCYDTLSKYFYIYPPIESLETENAFTPNGDQLNDIFLPFAIEGMQSYRLSIFNRWGERLFSSDNVSQGWDGTHLGIEVPLGVYLYTVEGLYADGKRYLVQGQVTLLR